MHQPLCWNFRYRSTTDEMYSSAIKEILNTPMRFPISFMFMVISFMQLSILFSHFLPFLLISGNTLFFWLGRYHWIKIPPLILQIGLIELVPFSFAKFCHFSPWKKPQPPQFYLLDGDTFSLLFQLLISYLMTLQTN